ncbi:MAG: NAD(P)H-dependent glycerol-3-phosphate dehydrogenase [Peptococcaceae bacterium]|nr:NAD(P)H-dependent glycerol-3-phosphate dehydrogenase [Peptococcaceae bacterium]
MDKVAVIGAGSWGTALAVLLARKGHPVCLYGRSAEFMGQLQVSQQNQRYLPGVMFPKLLLPTFDLAATLSDAQLVILAVPSHAVRETVGAIKPLLARDCVVVNTAKGFEQEKLLRLSQVLASELDNCSFAVLSGPSHAEEVGRDLPTTVVAAAHSREVAERVQDYFMTPHFRVYTNPDVIGVELGGALKNIIALCTGIAEGLGFGDNTKAALMTRGLAEIARLGVAMGAKAPTFAGLTGVGDLIVTCTSMHSRNRRAGILLGQGKPLKQVLEEVGMVVEGVLTTRGAYALAERYGVEMPIVEQAYSVLFGVASPRRAVANLMQRGRKHEIEEVAHSWTD